MKKLIGVALLGALCGCMVKASPTPLPDSETPNARIYLEKCSDVCHSAPHPKRHTSSQWEHMVRKMKDNMRDRGFAPLTAEEEKAILTYLQSHSR